MHTLIKNYADARYDNIFHTAKNVHDNVHGKKVDSIYMKMTYRHLNYAKKIDNTAILTAVDNFLLESYASRSKEDREKAASNIEKNTLVEGAVAAGVAAYQNALSNQKRIGGGKRRTKHRNTKSRKRRATKSRKHRR